MSSDVIHIPIQIQNPSDPDEPSIEKYIAIELLNDHRKYGRVWKCWMARTARKVLAKPTAIFEGIREKNFEGLCYCGKPAKYCIGDRRYEDLGVGFVFNVYILGSFIYDWEPVPCDDENKFLPENHEDRYGRLIWASIASLGT